MSGTTEIYLCRAGQSLKQGRVEYSDSIASRDEAQSDAEARCARDNKLAKIAYYAVNEEGDFRVIYTHNNPNAAGLGGDEETTPEENKKKKKKPVKRSLLSRLAESVFGNGKKSKKSKKSKKARR